MGNYDEYITELSEDNSYIFLERFICAIVTSSIRMARKFRDLFPRSTLC